MKKIQALAMLILVLSLEGWVSDPVQAQTPPPPAPPSQAPAGNGEEIIKQSKELLYRINDQKNKVTLTLIDQSGSKREIVAWRYWKNYNNQGGFTSKTGIFTLSPPDLRGQAILIWDYTGGKPEDLWLYLPVLRNTRRLQPTEQDEAFMGSDLTFGDMGQRGIEEDTHTLVGKEVYKGTPCFVVESVPKDKDSFYKKKVTWVSEKDYTIQKIDYYDRNGNLLKHQTIDWQILKGKKGNVYVWKRTDLVNVQTGHKTSFEVSDLKVNIGLSDNDFTERVLKMGGPRR
jgi:outer membrane lipoprotein-sorting protein